jgi:hypothetical protein
MTAPTPAVRALMMRRDGGQCVRCAIRHDLEAQHRQAVGMGGSKVRPTLDAILTLCSNCNSRAESDYQIPSLAFGWKVRRWVVEPVRVPVKYLWLGGWHALTSEGLRVPITEAEAAVRMRAVYGDEWDEWMKEAA